ncbi:Os08g0133650 [Oryza sativa Japonica Group]|uniref:Os08g0133650 protein n=2 Tax=Oryza TaxID=4527 RepID=C7J605_ORYSJ|nr:Os08g0133650 [Oryza sativa Japonica Group]|eukprot:NP_001175370.1 Os08g0133650 [Oryza sativa Japonica Group]
MAEGGNDGSVAGDRLMVATIKRKRELAEEDGDSSSPCSANRSLDMEVVEEKLYCSYGGTINFDRT